MNPKVSVASSQRVVFTDENFPPENIEASKNTAEVAQDPNEVVSQIQVFLKFRWSLIV